MLFTVNREITISIYVIEKIDFQIRQMFEKCMYNQKIISDLKKKCLLKESNFSLKSKSQARYWIKIKAENQKTQQKNIMCFAIM